MLDKLLLNPKTKADAERFLSDPGHNLLVVGEAGAGKAALARALGVSLLALKSERALANHPYWLNLTAEAGSISIDTIRQLKSFFKLKTTGVMPLRRAALIEDAHLMTPEAQTALLKTLEEPPADSVILLTASDQGRLLPTIISRVGQLTVLPVTKQQAAAYLRLEPGSGASLDLVYHLSEGLGGQISSFSGQEQGGALKASLQQAKLILSSPLLERLRLAETLAKDKTPLEPIFLGLRQVLRAATRQALASQNRPLAKRLNRAFAALLEAQTAFAKKASPKLVLLKLMVSL